MKICSIVDEYTREAIGRIVDRSITADDLGGHLEALAAQRGYPATLQMDNGPELGSATQADWAGDQVGLTFIPPGTPWLNGYIESFNGRLRNQGLNINSFYSLLQAQVVIGEPKTDYEARSHPLRHLNDLRGDNTIAPPKKLAQIAIYC